MAKSESWPQARGWQLSSAIASAENKNNLRLLIVRSRCRSCYLRRGVVSYDVRNVTNQAAGIHITKEVRINLKVHAGDSDCPIIGDRINQARHQVTGADPHLVQRLVF